MKFNLDTFINEDLNFITNPQLIVEITDQFWNIPFKEINKLKSEDTKSPAAKDLYKELKFSGWIDCTFEVFLELSLGEVLMLYKRHVNDEFDPDENSLKIRGYLVTLGRLYTNFI